MALSSRRRRLLVAVVASALLVLGGALVVTALDDSPTREAAGPDASAPGSGDDASRGTDGTEPAGASPASGAVGPTRHLGSQGRVGQFVVHCAYSHSGQHDPIVHFGHEGRSHRHDFYGSEIVDSDSTAESLLEGGTTCDKVADKAAYWHPTLYDAGQVVVPRSVSAYYRAAPGVDPTTVETMPTGLAMIAGDQTATSPQPGDAAGWLCGSRTRLSDEIPTCSSGAPLHLVLTYQDCWDGERTDSDDHQAHVAYSTEGRCPASHPVHIPQITVSVAFPIWGEGHDLTLASGPVYSAHGDFLNAWEPEGLQREIDRCIRRDTVCDLASNREEEPLFNG